MLKFLILILLLVNQVWAFDAEYAKALLDTLCGEEFAGRKSGEPTAHEAEIWIADKFAEFGLEPGGTEGYLQPFPILCNREVEASLELLNGYHGHKVYEAGQDFHLLTNSGSGEMELEVVFIGYSICEPDKGHDDFEGVDLAGKAALIYKDIPGPERIWNEERWREYKVNAAVEHGAAAILIVDSKDYPVSGAAVHQDAFHQHVPMMYIAEHVAVDIFKGTGKKFQYMQDDLKKGAQSFNTGKVMRIHAELIYEPEAEACNIIGIVPGSDPLLKDEWLVIGAHMDHNGINACGDVFYGADDNASGSSIVMELARYFTGETVSSKRSLMFITFAGEEQGLLGSKYFVNHPTIPWENIAAMFNYDCCGLGEGKVGLGGAEYFPQLWDTYMEIVDEEDFKLMNISSAWRYGSDQYYFHESGAPVFNCWSSGSRPFYHQVEDLPEFISLEAIGNLGRITQDFIGFIANWEQPLIIKGLYDERTLLYSSYTTDLNPIEKAALENNPEKLAEYCRLLRQGGVKCVLVEIRPETPYNDITDWRKFCDNNDFVWSKNAKGVKSARSRQKLALLPVLVINSDWELNPDNLGNLKEMGVNIIYLPSDSGARMNDEIQAFIAEAVYAGMAFIMNEDCGYDSLMDDESKRIILLNDDTNIPLVEEDMFNKVIYAVEFGFSILQLDTLQQYQRTVHITFSESGGLAGGSVSFEEDNDSPHQAMEGMLEYIETLETAGFSRQEISFMLGENLLDFLPE